MNPSITFREGILHYLLHTSKKEQRYLLHSVDGYKRQGLPLFFWKYPHFSEKATQKAFPISDNYGFEISEAITFNQLQILEYLFEEAYYENHGLRTEIDTMLLSQRYGEYALDILFSMQKIRYTIHNNNSDQKRNFPLISELYIENRQVIIEFSDQVSAIFLIDYLIPTQKVQKYLKLFQDNFFQAILFRYIISFPMALNQGLSCDVAVERIALPYNPFGLNQFANVINTQHNDLFHQLGIKLDSEGMRKIQYSESQYGKNLFVFPKIRLKNAMEMEWTEPIHVPVLSDTKSNQTSPAQKEAIDFSIIVLSEKMRDKALEMGYRSSEVDQLFTMFKNIYQQYTKKYYNLGSIWARFLKKKHVGFHPVVKSENRGHAANITLNDELREISQRYALSKEEEIESFTMFKNHYLSNGVIKKNWVGMWENWVIRNIQNRSKNTYGAKVKLETDYYVAQLVSKDIELMLEEHNVNLLDVMNGEVTLQNISYRNYPVPPSVGKGEVTIFHWKSRDAQHKAAAVYLQNHQKTASEYIQRIENNPEHQRLISAK